MRAAHLQAAYYLAGLFDGEGHIERGRFVISNTDESIIDTATDALDMLGIGYRVRVRDRPGKPGPHLPCAEIMVCRIADRQRFNELIPIRSGAKQQRMNLDHAANQLRLVG